MASGYPSGYSQDDITRMENEDATEDYFKKILQGKNPGLPILHYDTKQAQREEQELQERNQEVYGDMQPIEEERVVTAVEAFRKENGNENLQNTFDKIFHGQASPVVIVVGFKEFERIKGNILQLFDDSKKDRPDSQQLPPTVVLFTLEELNNKRFNWTKNSTIVDETITKYLENNSQFVFYRMGSYSDVNDDVTKATNVICHEMCWPHHLLVVGDDIGLEEALHRDIQIVAAIAGLDDKCLKALHDSIKTDEYNSYGHYYGKSAVFTLLIAPSTEFLRKTLKNKILLCNATTLTVYYSGHGEEDGSWAINGDENFSGSDLKTLLQDVKPQHYPRIHILLNSCYGFAFVEDISRQSLDILITGLSMYLPDILQDSKALVPSGINGKDIVEWAISYVSNENEKEKDCWHIVNKCINKGVYKMVKTAGYRIGTVNFGKYRVSVVPFSAGYLNANGILPLLYKINENVEIDRSHHRSLPKLKPLRNPVANSSPVNPHVIIFPAARGDSTLFRWDNFNMLVDGGLKKSPPCFWNTVSKLPQDQKLDVVVVTHYDADHIVGILSMFNREETQIEIDKLCTTTPSQSPQSRSEGQGLSLCRQASKHGVKTLDLVTDPTTVIVDRPINGSGFHLRIFMLTPNYQNLEKAKKMMPNRNLTVPNLACASLLIECKSGDKYMYALLTGDAPGIDIIKGLRQLKDADSTVKEQLYRSGRYNFAYVDIPHHGSRHNNPRAFLDAISTEVCLISTDSNKYCHPDDETLESLCDVSTKVDHLLFTYQERRPNKCFAKFKENFKGKCHFAKNANYKGQEPVHETKCWLVDLAAADKFTERACDSVLVNM